MRESDHFVIVFLPGLRVCRACQCALAVHQYLISTKQHLISTIWASVGDIFVHCTAHSGTLKRSSFALFGSHFWMPKKRNGNGFYCLTMKKKSKANKLTMPDKKKQKSDTSKTNDNGVTYCAILVPGRPYRLVRTLEEGFDYIPNGRTLITRREEHHPYTIVAVERINSSVAMSMDRICDCYPMYAEMFTTMLTNPIECLDGWYNFLEKLILHEIMLTGRKLRRMCERLDRDLSYEVFLRCRKLCNLFNDYDQQANRAFNKWFREVGAVKEESSKDHTSEHAFFDAVEECIELIAKEYDDFIDHYNIDNETLAIEHFNE